MAQAKIRTPAIEGWFTLDADDPRLLGSRCRSCQTYFFPRETVFCRNPRCTGEELALLEALFEEGGDQSDAAARLGKKPGAVWTATNRLRKKLREKRRKKIAIGM